MAELVHIDAELLELGRALDAAWTCENVLVARDGDTDELFDSAVDAGQAITAKIASLPARTIDGLRVKAKAAAWCHCDEIDFGNEIDGVLAGSIVRDLLAMQG